MTAPFVVAYVFLDEATPRDLHKAQVEAVDEDDARLRLLGSMPCDRVSVVATSREQEPHR